MAQDFEKELAIADVYAAALYALAADAGQVDAVRGELEDLVRMAEADPALAAFLSSGAIDDDDRQRSLENIFRGRLSDTVLNTLQVLNQHGRLGLLSTLLRAYIVRQEAARGEVEVTVTSAVALDAGQKSQVEQVAASLSGKKPLIDFVVDPNILGGLVLQIGDRRLDNSLRQQLETARRLLLERTSRQA